jgi:copper chaperone CopZ
MKKSLVVAVLALAPLAARAQYRQIKLTVFGMDCAPCAHAIHVSMMGIQGVDKVDVNLNTGLVSIQLAPDNHAGMRQFNNAVERNGFTHKDAAVVVRGTLSGTPAAPVLEITGTPDRFQLQPSASPVDLTPLFGKSVLVTGVLPQAPRGKVSEQFKYSAIAAITEAQ